jgi:hypothetical protein
MGEQLTVQRSHGGSHGRRSHDACDGTENQPIDRPVPHRTR